MGDACLDDTQQINQLFSQCDLDGSGFIDQNELASICTDLSPEQIADVFRELDTDGDGQISIAEFANGLKGTDGGGLFTKQPKRNISQLQTSSQDSEDEDRVGRKRRSFRGRQADSEEVELADFVGSLDEGFSVLSCQEHVCDLYQKLHNVNEPNLLSHFENVVLSIIKDVRQQQCDNERLERSYKREKDIHGKHLRQLEEEMEVQIQKAENRIRREERLKLEAQKEEMKLSFQNEVKDLQNNLNKFKQVEHHQSKSSETEDMKKKLDELLHENRQLKSQLTDVETTLVVTKSEVVNLKQDLDEKAEELDSDKSTLVEYLSEQENLQRQLRLLHQANKKLHDTNDSLRESLETNRTSYRRQHSAHHSNPAVVVLQPFPRPSVAHSHKSAAIRRGSVMSDYMGNTLPSPGESPSIGQSSLMDELNSQHGSVLHGYASGPHGMPLPHQDSCEVDSLPDDMDSGHSTLRDIPDIDSEYEPQSADSDPSYRGLKGPAALAARRRHRANRRRMQALRQQNDSGNTGTESELFESHDDVEDFVDGFSAGELHAESYQVGGYDDESDVSMSGSHHGRPGSACSCGSSSSRHSPENGQVTMGTNGKILRIVPSQTVAPMKMITKEPEHVYKIILAGDAAVGKSSFIMRLCKGLFVNNISSTLGVDFQTKTIEVDGRVIALQLWDTAGQERFRSVAMSYFRRADGVLLLYDVSYERSFIDVRDWVDSIEEGTSSNKKIPIMLVGNKCDLRDPSNPDGKYVTTEDGKRLAKEVDAMFIESSAKAGDNILEAVTELTRILRTNEDLEVRSAGMTLTDISQFGNKKKQSSCCT